MMYEAETFLRFPPDAAVVVTGAASGIGRGTAELAASVGLGVGAWDLNADGAREVAAVLDESGARSHPVTVDVTDARAVAAAFAETAEALGPVRYLVNNAGPTSFVTRPFADGLVAAAASMVTVTDAWLAAGRAPGDAVVNLSSVAGTSTGVGDEAWYPSAKAAIAGYTRYLALNRPQGIRANAVAPGLIRTPRLAEFIDSPAGEGIMARNPMGRAGEPADVAAAICFLLSPVAEYVNGVILPVDGGSLVTL